MMHASTSPFYPLFAALDVNAKMHEGESGKRLWMNCVKQGLKPVNYSCNPVNIFARLFQKLSMAVHGKILILMKLPMISDSLIFCSESAGTSFEGYEENQYFVDPCKLLLTTPGINAKTGKYESFGVPATILANYLRENNIIPEKCDLNSILFLLTPAESMAKMQHLVAQNCFALNNYWNKMPH